MNGLTGRAPGSRVSGSRACGSPATSGRGDRVKVRRAGRGVLVEPMFTGAYDVLLAGQARRHGATLVTSNTKEFARVSGLKWEDWAASRRCRRVDVDGPDSGLRQSDIVVAGQDRAVPVAVPRSRRRLPASIREPEDGQVWLCARLRQRVGARHLREAAHQVRRMSQSSIPSGHRRRHPLAPVRPRRRGPALRRWRLSAAPGRDVLLPGRRFRQGRLARGCRGLSRSVSPPEPPGRPRTVTLRTRRACLVLLRGGHSGRAGPTAGIARPHRDDGGTSGHRPGFVRPAVSESGHDAARRIREPDRPAAAEGAAQAGQQRLSR